MVKKNKKSQKNNYWRLQRWPMISLITVVIIIMAMISIRGRFLALETIFNIPTPTPSHPADLNFPPPEAFGQTGEAYINKAKSDLSAKLKIDEEQIKVVSTKPYKWSDSSLGCPEKGKFYSQVVTAGYVINLSVNDKSYTY